jgi:hypothetical protein
MRRLALLFSFTLLLLPAQAETGAKTIVENFYKDYNQALATTPQRWMETLMNDQREHVEDPLRDLLLRLAAGDPNKGEPFLDFDPFSNSQQGLDSYTVGEPTMKGGLAYVPIKMRVGRSEGPEVMRARFVLRKQGYGWQIANVVYPAENGMAAWDLLGYLKDTFK